MEKIFDTIIERSSTFDTATYAKCMVCALLCGLVVAFASSFRANTSKSFFASLVILPSIVTTVIIMVNGNIGTGVAVMGAFSLIRFRSVPGKARDIASIFLAMTSGLTCAAGYVAVAVLFTVFSSLIIALMAFLPHKSHRIMDLRITVPETLSFYDAFDDVFEKYTHSHTLIGVKTSNVGSLYKLSYKVQPKDKALLREFIDELRTRNGNLEISLSESVDSSEEL